jgi:hypothetical protein
MMYDRLSPGTFSASNFRRSANRIEPTGNWEWGGVHFSHSAKDISLHNGHELHATLRKKNGDWHTPASLDLGRRIQNLDGVLTFGMHLFCLSLH